MQKVAVFGTGYVGLVTGACLAQVGNRVICVDIDEKKIERLKAGECPIFEPGLEEVLKGVIAQGTLTFTTDGRSAIAASDIVMSAVGTPPGNDGSADLSFVRTVAEQIGEQMDGYRVIVTKSTVPPLTGKMVEDIIAAKLKERGVDHGFAVVSNPEFLKEGSAVADFLKPDRIVVGVNDDRAREMMERLYEPFMRSGYRVIFTDRVSAEMIKYAANSMLATRISFMNEIAQLAEKVGADVEEIRRGIASDTRIGKAFLYAGPGYGGSCFPKDVKALAHFSRQNGCDPTILDAVEEVNASQRVFIADKVIATLGGSVSGKKIAAWGLAFKANTDDVRESPAIEILEHLMNAGATVVAYDPEGKENFIAFTSAGTHANISYADDQYAALDGADALLVLTEWPQFRAPDLDQVKERLAAPVIVDARNLYDPKDIRAAGFTYSSVGRP